MRCFVLLSALLLVYPFASAEGATYVGADVQGSVSWPSALAGQTFTFKPKVMNVTRGTWFTPTLTFRPDQWPDPNQGGFYTTVGVNDKCEASFIAADHDPQIYTGSDGKQYAAYVAGDNVVQYFAVMSDLNNGIVLDMTIGIVVRQEDPDNTDPTPQDGDTNKDGDCDWFDISRILLNFGMQSGATWEHGDCNGDGDVDFGDYLDAVENFVPWY